MNFKNQGLRFYRSWTDPLRGWFIEVIKKDGSKRVVAVNPLGYESVLEDLGVEVVYTLGFGLFSELSLDPIILDFMI